MRAVMVTPAFFTDPQLALVSPGARILYQGLRALNGFGGGVVEYRPRRIANAVLPYEPHELLPRLVGELVAAGVVVHCRVDGLDCLRVLPLDPRRRNRPGDAEWAMLRAEVFERDDYTCRYCGQRGGPLECDHVVPASRGGASTTDNLVTACRACNRTKSDRTPDEWGMGS